MPFFTSPCVGWSAAEAICRCMHQSAGWPAAGVQPKPSCCKRWRRNRSAGARAVPPLLAASTRRVCSAAPLLRWSAAAAAAAAASSVGATANGWMSAVRSVQLRTAANSRGRCGGGAASCAARPSAPSGSSLSGGSSGGGGESSDGDDASGWRAAIDILMASCSSGRQNERSSRTSFPLGAQSSS